MYLFLTIDNSTGIFRKSLKTKWLIKYHVLLLIYTTIKTC